MQYVGHGDFGSGGVPLTILELQAVRLTLKVLPNNSHICNTWDTAILDWAAFRLRFQQHYKLLNKLMFFRRLVDF